jgi:hypothetical protein
MKYLKKGVEVGKTNENIQDHPEVLFNSTSSSHCSWGSLYSKAKPRMHTDSSFDDPYMDG